VFNATFSNISAISWRPVLVVEEAGSTRREPQTLGKQLANYITCGCESSAPILAHLPSLGVRRPSVNISLPASSTTKTGRHDIAEILLKVALNTENSNSFSFGHCVVCSSTYGL
jgi:hypothetical protein